MLAETYLSRALISLAGAILSLAALVKAVELPALAASFSFLTSLVMLLAMALSGKSLAPSSLSMSISVIFFVAAFTSSFSYFVEVLAF